LPYSVTYKFGYYAINLAGEGGMDLQSVSVTYDSVTLSLNTPSLSLASNLPLSIYATVESCFGGLDSLTYVWQTGLHPIPEPMAVALSQHSRFFEVGANVFKPGTRFVLYASIFVSCLCVLCLGCLPLIFCFL
jgi:hypothetical protein